MGRRWLMHDCVLGFGCRNVGQPRLIRFFLGASARSKLRRWTLMPNRVSISSRHCEVVSCGLAALRATTKATTSAEIFSLMLCGARRLTMREGMKLIDSTIVIVLHNGDQEIERELTSPADALRVALMMLARRGRLEIGDVLEVVAPS